MTAHQKGIVIILNIKSPGGIVQNMQNVYAQNRQYTLTSNDDREKSICTIPL